MSRGYSRIIIVGNLGRDPEMRYTPSGTPVTNFSVAVNRRRPTGGGEYQDETDWYRVAVFGRMAEVADQYLVRGMKVLVDGQPQIRSFTGQDGVERTSIEINADNFVMLNTREESEALRAGAGAPMGQSGDFGGSPRGGARDAGERYDDFEDDDLDDVPF
ncbi:MAG TPA: single-stranded DNA-binding protein [Thermomicrobiales bacterium]|nr:single-stranded DNA-binding protein [Thermomicrobiales bacterium]